MIIRGALTSTLLLVSGSALAVADPLPAPGIAWLVAVAVIGIAAIARTRR